MLSANQLFRALVNNPGPNLNNVARVAAIGHARATSTRARPTRLCRCPRCSTSTSARPRWRRQRSAFSAPTAKHTPWLEQIFTTGQGSLGEVQVDLRGLAPGPYRIEVLDAAWWSILAGSRLPGAAATAETWFGVIEIVTGTADFALLNADGTLRARASCCVFSTARPAGATSFRRRSPWERAPSGARGGQ